MSHDLVEVLPAPTPDERRRALAVGVVIVVLAVVVGFVSWASAHGRPSTAPEHATLTCPASSVRSEAPRPTTPTGDSLVPDRTPTTVVLCEYPTPDTLARSARYRGDDARLAYPLSVLRSTTSTSPGIASGCVSSPATPPFPQARVGLTFDDDDGVVWVGPGWGCHAVTNGAVTGVVDLPGLVARVLDAGSAAIPVDPTPPDTGAPGRPAAGPTIALEPDVPCSSIGGETWASSSTAADGTTAVAQVDAGGCGTVSNGVRRAGTDAAFLTALAATD